MSTSATDKTTLKSHVVHALTTHGTHCLKEDCVLPHCINSKLGKMCEGIRQTKKFGRKPENMPYLNDGIEMSAAGNQATEFSWMEDLEDISSILGLGTNNMAAILDGTHLRSGKLNSPAACGNYPLGRSYQKVHHHNSSLITGASASKSYRDTTSAVNESDDGKDWAARTTFAEGPRLPQENSDSLETLCTLFSGTKEQPSRHYLQVNKRMSNSFVTRTTYPGNGKHDALNHPCQVKPKRSRCLPRKQRFHLKYSTNDPEKRKVSCLETEEHGSACRKRNLQHDRSQFTSKLFGVLFLISQVFESPLTHELEEMYLRVLQKAYKEIQTLVGR